MAHTENLEPELWVSYMKIPLPWHMSKKISGEMENRQVFVWSPAPFNSIPRTFYHLEVIWIPLYPLIKKTLSPPQSKEILPKYTKSMCSSFHFAWKSSMHIGFTSPHDMIEDWDQSCLNLPILWSVGGVHSKSWRHTKRRMSATFSRGQTRYR